MGKEVHLETLHDEAVRDAAKGILQVKEGDVGCPLLLPRVLHDLLHCQIVLNAAVDAWQECLLHCGVNEFVVNEKRGEARVEEQVKGLADTSAEGDHPEVGGV